MSRSGYGGQAFAGATPQSQMSQLSKAYNNYLDLERARVPQSPGLLSGDMKANYVGKSRLKSASSVRSKSVNREGGGERRRFKRFNEEVSDASVRRSNLGGVPRKP